MGEESLASTRIRSPDRPASIQSLYRLRYPSPYIFNYLFKTFNSSFRILYHNYHNNHLKTFRIRGDVPCTPNLLRLLLILVDELKIFVYPLLIYIHFSFLRLAIHIVFRINIYVRNSRHIQVLNCLIKWHFKKVRNISLYSTAEHFFYVEHFSHNCSVLLCCWIWHVYFIL
jgi:hypothetical protein